MPSSISLSTVSLVPVPVMDVRIVRMGVAERGMRVLVGVRFARVGAGCVLMAVLRVVLVPVTVRRRLVHVEVLVSLGEMQPDARGHEGAAGQQPPRYRLSPQQNGCDRADEGSGG